MKTQISYHPQNLLKREFLRRKERNPRYSMRSFAASIGISSGRLSQLLSGKRAFTLTMVDKVAQKLDLGPKDRRQLQNFVLAQKHKVPLQNDQISLKEDEFQAISDPLVFDLLSLLQTDNSVGSPAWLARRLGVSVIEISHHLECLTRLKLVEQSEGSFKVVHKAGLTTTNEIPSELIRNAHRKNLNFLLKNLDDVSVSDRHLSSTSLAIDPEKIPQAKKLIQDFITKFSSFVETSPTSEVYRLNIQFWPSTLLKETSQ